MTRRDCCLVRSMTPEDTKLMMFLRRLFEKTKTGEVPWEPGEDSNCLSIALPSYTVLLRRDPPAEQSPEAFMLRIQNEDQMSLRDLSDFEAKSLGAPDLREFFDY